MLSLREEVLRRFETITSPIVLVSDPDSLLAEEHVAEILHCLEKTNGSPRFVGSRLQ